MFLTSCTGTGKITPFDNIPGLNQSSSIQELPPLPQSERITAQNLRRPGFETKPRAAPVKRTEEQELSSSEHSGAETEEEDISINRRRTKRVKVEDEDYEPEAKTTRRKLARHSEVAKTATESEDSEEDDCYVGAEVAVQRKRSKKPARDAYDSKPVRLDDGDEKLYQKRLRAWIQSRRAARGTGSVNDEELEEWQMPHPTFPDEEISGGEFRLPGDIHPSLFPYQKVCVQWLWELRCQKSGGILSDEMVRPSDSHRGLVADICWYRGWGRQ